MARGLFIALEGIDGSGKSTHSKILAQKLTQLGRKVHHTFEPTDNVIGKVIRQIIKGETKSHQTTIAGLFVSDRLDHVLHEDYGMQQYIESGTDVITDRYYFSSYAYHAVHVDMDWVIDANAMSARILRPDINIFIDINPELALERINTNRAQKDIYESLDNLQKVRNNYFIAFEKLAKQETICIINGDQNIDDLAGNIFNEIKKLIL